ncbi:MMPL family transporter [Rhodococcus triatomae]|uniref:Putative drug exporter of the RND superfamily n=1 Tax=Rhodococcus triatomae TaxID=300028 RepID=A0A1G8AZR3_9NOCA|nr:MMPL family transporter [Rhodococcus triatomae]QNG17624.1 MMPL family transporter [Rhodococcus triatomae]QNG22709.1 MMPL family transporter [Rhodococcus triatomae]SDH26522.1 putative drug exporter of the RND superfamily [Rhodococcus triatomae]
MVGRFVTTRPRRVVAIALLLLLVLGGAAAGTMNALSLNRFEPTDAESTVAERLAEERFGAATPNIAVHLTPRDGRTVSDPAVENETVTVMDVLREQNGVDAVWSYRDPDASPTLTAEDGTSALIMAWAPGDADQVRRNVLPVVEERLDALSTDLEAIDIVLAGGDQVFRAVAEQARADFLRAELLIAPLVVGLLWIVFRRLGLALVVFGIGVFSVVASLAILRGVTLFTEVSTFAANIVLVMGIALGVDYGLFLVYRFREELRAGREVADAVRTSLAAAGRTIVFSGATVAASLSVLFVFPFPFLSSFAYAGIAVVLTAVAGATVILPAALMLLGRRALARRDGPSASAARWGRLAAAITRRPLAGALGGVTVLVLLGAPALGVVFGPPDDRVLPASQPVRAVYDTIRADFLTEDADAVTVVPVATGPVDLADHAARVAELPGVLRVDTLTSVTGDSALRVLPTAAQLDRGADELVDDVRAIPSSHEVVVGGAPALLADYNDGVVSRLPLAAALIAVVSFGVLFLMTGSVVAPLKATVLNLLSLSVMFGVLVWGFQEGNLAWLLGFTPTGSIESSIPILMFCIAYGLSMDYEVFLLSRIKEEYERTGDTTLSVIRGVSRSAPLVSAAALVLAASFALYATSGITFLQQLGIGMALAVLVDATVVRGVLVPALMTWAGPWNWWAPAPLRRLHRRIGIGEGIAPETATPSTERTGADVPG